MSGIDPKSSPPESPSIESAPTSSLSSQIEGTIPIVTNSLSHNPPVNSDINLIDNEIEEKKVELRPEEKGDVAMDRYGFYITDKDRYGAELPIQEGKQYKEKETERTRKWIKMVKNGIFHVNSEKLQRRVRKGIPDIVRAKVWTDFSHITEYKQKYPVVLSSPVSSSSLSLSQTIFEEIERDLDRTFPRHVIFVRRGGEGQDSLRRILQHYVELDPEIGYCQGMGFIAAMFLTYMVEDDAFYCLVSIMQRPSLPLRLMFKANFVQAQCMLSVFWSLLSDTYPKLYKHLERENLHPSMFATEWFLTIFTRSFPFSLVTRVWDVFISEMNYKILYRVSLALLKSISKQLKLADFENIMRLLKDLPRSINPHHIMELAWSVPIKRARITELEAFHTYVADTSPS